MEQGVAAGDGVETPVGTITLRYWAAARAAAGVAEEAIPAPGPVSLADLRLRAVALHPGTNLQAVLGVCSALVGDRPVGSRDPATVEVVPGETVEFLPPFAGG